MKKSILVILFFIACNVHSTEIESTIKRLMMDENYGDIVHIELDSRQPEPISCHTNTSWEYVLDVSTALGGKIYSSLLAAYASKSIIKFVGRENCTVSPHNNTESLRRIELK